MNFTRPALALFLTASSTMAAAQYFGSLPEPEQKEQKPAAAQANAGPTPSAKAQKAIIDLQTAVNANDVANIPAKVAAAQAVASTNADRYWIAQLQLKAAAKANNVAAEAAAIDALAASGLVQSAQ